MFFALGESWGDALENRLNKDLKIFTCYGRKASSVLGIRVTAENSMNVVDCIECYDSVHKQPAAVIKILLSISENTLVSLAAVARAPGLNTRTCSQSNY